MSDIAEHADSNVAEPGAGQNTGLFSRVLDNLLAFVGVLTPDGTLIEANRAPLEAAGITASDVLGKRFWDCLWWSYSPEVQAQLREVIARANAGETVRYDVQVRMAGDSRMWIDFQLAPLRGDTGRITHLVASAMDITERKQAEETLRATTTLLQAISDHTGDVIFAKDRDGRLTFANPATLALIGKPAEQVIGRTDAELLEDAQAAREIMENDRRVMQSGSAEDLEEVVPLSDGTHRVWSSRKMPYRDAQGNVIGLLGVSRDITERKRAEEQLRTTLESIADGFFACDADWRFVYVNAPAERILGMGRQEVLGRNFWDVFPLTVGTRLEEEYRRAAAGQIRDFENHYVPWGRWFHNRCFPREGGGMSVYFQDITERKRSEQALRDAQEQLRRHAYDLEKTVHERTAKLQETVHELEQYSYSISHDMRAPLRAMSQFSHIVLEEYGPKLGKEGEMYLQRIAAAAGRLDHLIHDVLSYHRLAQADMTLETVNLDTLTRDIIQQYPMIQASRAQVEVHSPLAPVCANLAALTQCLSNLLGNAVKFVSPGVRPHVRIWTESRNSVVRVWIEDNGIGVEPSQLERIWTIFHQAHHSKAYEGTGIGLSIVKKAVERMGGRVGVESQPGAGSRFWFELKAAC